MKIHRLLVTEIINSLYAIFGENWYADKLIEKTLRAQKKWGARDRDFFASSVYGMVRSWRYLWFLSGNNPTIEKGALWNLWAIWWLHNEHAIPDWPEFKHLDLVAIAKRQNLQIPLAVRESIPDWLDQIGAAEIGCNWPNILKNLNNEAPVFLRVNTLKSSREKLLAILHDIGLAVAAVPESPSAIVLKQRKNVFQSQPFKDGLFEVQDGGSQLIAPFLDTAPGMRVIDACAGAGGKTLHLASLMKNQGRIIALDVHPHKLAELERRARRAGTCLITTKIIDNNKVIKRLTNSADRVLLDVPCSGLGVLRRNPDTKWKLTPDNLIRIKELQAQLLNDYSKMVKPGGKLVYATCSVLPSENQEQISSFLQVHGDYWCLEDELHIPPGMHNFDGFYAARLQRQETKSSK